MCGAWLKNATMPAMAASRNDCAAKMRMLVTIQRCATMAICMTRTKAAMRVTILSPNCMLGKVGTDVIHGSAWVGDQGREPWLAGQGRGSGDRAWLGAGQGRRMAVRVH